MKELILSLLALMSLQVTIADQPACERAADLGYEIMEFFDNNYNIRRLTQRENKEAVRHVKEGVGNFTVDRTDLDDKEQRNALICKVFAAKTFDDAYELLSLPDYMSQYVTKDQICFSYQINVADWDKMGMVDKNRRKYIFSYFRDLISWMSASGFPDIPIRGEFEENVAALQELRDRGQEEVIISELNDNLYMLPLGVTKIYNYNEDYSDYNITEHSFDTEELVTYMTESGSIYGYLDKLFTPEWSRVKRLTSMGEMYTFFEMAKWESGMLDKVEEFLNLVMDESNIAKLDTSACAELPDYSQYY